MSVKSSTRLLNILSHLYITGTYELRVPCCQLDLIPHSLKPSARYFPEMKQKKCLKVLRREFVQCIERIPSDPPIMPFLQARTKQNQKNFYVGGGGGGGGPTGKNC
jgi:hypothetical protein